MCKTSQEVTLYNQTHKLEFYHITKNAMTSIRRGFPDGGFRWISTEEVDKSARTFCVLRKVFQRAVSSYKMIIKLLRKSDTRYSLRQLRDKDVEVLINGDLTSSISCYLDQLEEGFFDTHCVPQLYFLGRFFNNQIVKRTANFKPKKRSVADVDLFLDLDVLDLQFERLGINTKLPCLNSRRKKRKSEEEEFLYSTFNQYEDRVNKIYACDLALRENINVKV